MSKRKTSYFEDDDNFEEDNNSENEKSSDDENDDESEDEIIEDNDVDDQGEHEIEVDDDETELESDEESINEDMDEQNGGAEDEAEDIENVDDDGNVVTKKNKKSKKITINPSFINAKNDDEDEENDDDGELYLKKFDKEINDNYIVNFHPECALQNYDEIFAMTKVVRDENGIIVDELHRTIPYLTKYEKARILGQRAKQINAGTTPFVKVPENVIDGYLIAELELQQKRIPFIIRRPLPNGGSEYWSLKDLENITF